MMKQFFFHFFAMSLSAVFSLLLTACNSNNSQLSAEKQAILMIQKAEAECVIVSDGKIVAAEKGRGVSPLLFIYDNMPEKMAGATVVDKVIGRAAAAIAIAGKAKKVHGELISEDAQFFLHDNHIEVSYNLMVPRILNRNRDDICPLERSVEGISDPIKAVQAMKKAIAEMQSKRR